ncbi:mechanosensitive ion channel family protein [Sphingobacterium sp. SGR-19]|uniref:mechanosensitive ion channel family protein n=1 Tax=Sphingobacterium sp. SGR-19 TaxID=2710886 RepID=UPI0013ED2FB3|nr:mechanosensitive ion channel domain-containing protein [Sphingobacterium sp. SGR-19]NGM63710.1 mechanosensitive ion channel [Sphingobacterium sp. SGR-19]
MTEEKKDTNPIPFLIKLFLWVLLYTSFWYFGDSYKERPWLNNLSNALNLFLTSSILFSIGRYIIIMIYNKRHEKRAVRGNFVLGINRLTVVLNTTMAIIAFMIAFGIDPRDFVTSLTIVAMAVAVTFREYITNLISGLFIMFSDQLSVGDRVKVGEHKGRIVDINFSSLVIQNEDDDMVMVPNNMVFTSPIINLSAHRSSLFLVKFELPLQAAVEVDKLEESIRALLVNHPYLTGEDELQLKVVEIGKDYVKYKMEIHAKSSSNKVHKQVENEVFKEVLKFKREYDINT